MVERPAVNRQVIGSSPIRGVSFRPRLTAGSFGLQAARFGLRGGLARKPAESGRFGDCGAWPAALSVRDLFRANRSGHRVSRHRCVEILSNSRSLGLTGRRVNRLLSTLEDGIACESELACAQFVLFLNAPARGFPYRGHRRGCRRTQHCGASARAGPCGHHPCRTSVATNRFRRSSRHVHAVSGFGRREVSPLGSDVPRSFACTGAPRGANCRSAIWTVSGVLLPATGATSLCGSFEPACRTGHAAGLCGGA